MCTYSNKKKREIQKFEHFKITINTTDWNFLIITVHYYCFFEVSKQPMGGAEDRCCAHMIHGGGWLRKRRFDSMLSRLHRFVCMRPSNSSHDEATNIYINSPEIEFIYFLFFLLSPSVSPVIKWRGGLAVVVVEGIDSW